MSERILICGSRGLTAEDVLKMKKVIDKLPEDTFVIEGGAPGADQAAYIFARRRGFDIQEFKADWRLGKQAGFVRNIQMLEEGKPDRVIAFHKNNSPGTAHTIEQAKIRDIPVEVITL